MAGHKTEKGYLNGQFLQASALPMMNGYIQNLFSVNPAFYERAQRHELSQSPGKPIDYAYNDAKIIAPLTKVSTSVIDDKSLIHLAQQSPEYQKAVHKGLVTNDEIYGRHTREAMLIMARDGRLDQKIVDVFMAAHPLKDDPVKHYVTPTSINASNNPTPLSLPNTPVYCAGDSIGKALGPNIKGAGAITNCAQNGQRFEQMIQSSDIQNMLQNCAGKFFVISIGTNDMLGNQDPKKLAAKIANVAADIKNRGGVPVMLGIHPIKEAYSDGGIEWHKDNPVEAKKVIDRWNARAEEFNKTLPTNLKEKSLSDNFVATEQTYISNDHLHPVIAEVQTLVSAAISKLSAPKG